MQFVQQPPAARVRQGTENGVVIHVGNMQPYGCLSRQDFACWGENYPAVTLTGGALLATANVNPDANRPEMCYTHARERCRMPDTETKSIFDIEPDEAAERAADAAAEAEIDAGRFVPHAEVAKWLRSWGTPNKLPRPRPKA
jgi:predicted transcriptional regulator